MRFFIRFSEKDHANMVGTNQVKGDGSAQPYLWQGGKILVLCGLKDEILPPPKAGSE
jgi:hypothetical protein